jgi:hypothetical protein
MIAFDHMSIICPLQQRFCPIWLNNSDTKLSFEQTWETLALLKLLALGNQDIEAGKMMPANEFIARLRTEQ